MTSGRTLSGRTRVGRFDSRYSYCIGCEQRITKGEPKPSSSWASAITETRHNLDLWLQAAAEYSELCEEAGEPMDVVAFIDWVTPDALSPEGIRLHVEFDGAPPRNDLGRLTQRNDRSAHRHPFVLPQAGWRPSMREGAE